MEELRLELDQSELKHQELVEKMQQLGEEATGLRGVVVELQRQLDTSLAAQEEQRGLEGEVRALRGREEALCREVETLRAAEKARVAEQCLLQEKLTAAEGKNIELLAKLDGVLDEKGQQAASHFDSAQKIHELLDRLKEAEKGTMEAVAQAEEKRRLADRLQEEVVVKEDAAKDAETKLTAITTSASEEKATLEEKVSQLGGALNTLQGALTLREKEVNNVQRQLQDLQRAAEEKEKEVEEAKRSAQDVQGEMQKKMSCLKESLEAEVSALKEQLERKEAKVTSDGEMLQQLEASNQNLSTERDKLNGSLAQLETTVKEQETKMEDYKTQCASLMELNEKLLTTVKRNEELKKEMAENRAGLENEVASLRASERQLRGQLEDTKMTVDGKEKRLREDNRRLDESLQRANMALKQSEATSKQLEQENQSLREEQDTVKAALSRMQTDLKSVHGQIGELEKNLGASRKNEACLQEQLQGMEAQLERKDKNLAEFKSRIAALEAVEKELEKEKANAEATCARQADLMETLTSEKQAIERSQLEMNAVQTKENQEVTCKLTMVEGQLEVSIKEVSRLQADILALRVKAQRAEEEKLKYQAQLEVTEAQRDEFRTLTEQLKSQTETLNQSHINELVEFRKKEEVLAGERDREVAAHAELSISATAIREELSTLKAENNRLALENGEIREGLHRANTEMAELGMTICTLSAQKEEARNHKAGDAARIEELKKEAERREDAVTQLEQEKRRLEEELAQKEGLPGTITGLQQQLEKAANEVQRLKDASQEEMKAVKFQISSEIMSHQVQMKVGGSHQVRRQSVVWG